MNLSGFVSYIDANAQQSSVWDSVRKTAVQSFNTRLESTPHGQAIVFNGSDAYLNLGNSPQFYPSSFILWVDVVVGNQAGEQHIYGHLGRDADDYWCNAQITWDAQTGTICFRVGAQSVFEIAQSGYSPNQRYKIAARCYNQTLDCWVNGVQIGALQLPRALRMSSAFGLWAGQRDYLRYGSRAPFKGLLYACGLAQDTSNSFIAGLFAEQNPPSPAPVDTNQAFDWYHAEQNALSHLFQYGQSAVYVDALGNSIPCQVFLDTGWRDALSQYESHAAGFITQISVLRKQILKLKAGDTLIVQHKHYQITAIDSEDDYLAILNVQHVN